MQERLLSYEPAVSAYEYLDEEYPYLTDALRSKPSNEVSDILDNLDMLGTDGIHKFLFERLFSIEHSAKILWNLKPNPNADTVLETDAPILINELLENRGVKKLIPILWNQVFEWEDKQLPETTRPYSTYKLGLSLLLTQLSSSEAPFSILNEIDDERYLNYRIEPTNFPWHMCEKAEENMETSLSDDISGVVLVDEILLTKVSHGKLSAICIYPAATPSGIFVPGSWYSPVDESMRKKIVDAYSNGKTRLYNKEEASWALMRGINTYSAEGEKTPEEFLENLRLKAKNLPLKAPKKILLPDSVGLVSRKEAREKLKEEYEDSSGHFPRVE